MIQPEAASHYEVLESRQNIAPCTALAIADQRLVVLGANLTPGSVMPVPVSDVWAPKGVESSALGASPSRGAGPVRLRPRRHTIRL